MARHDKWYLGSGDGLVWAPPFPQWLDVPGYWDEAHLFQYAVGPLFTLSVIAGGEALASRCLARTWEPAVLTLDHAFGPLRARETRAVDGRTLRSEWEFRGGGRARTIDVVVWTAIDAEALAGEVRREPGGLTFLREVRDRRAHRALVSSRLTLRPRAHSYDVNWAQRSGPAQPHFALTPFFDRWAAAGSGRLGNRLARAGIVEQGVVFLGLARRVRVPARGAVRLTAALALDLHDAVAGSKPARSRRPAGGHGARADWTSFFTAVPAFRCSDHYLDRHWRHRWYGLRLLGITPGASGAPRYRYPTVTEGIAYFHTPISYSAPCHARELRWLAHPAWARGVIRTFLVHQGPDGALPGRVYPDHEEGADFYHADWGGAVLALDAVHPDPAFAAEIYPALARYGHWLTHTRDVDLTGMIDVVDQFETGQEYMSRYQAVDSGADRYGWQNRIRLKGVDVTVYAYRLFRALEVLAERHAPAAAAEWRNLAERSGRALRDTMWDAATALFSDVAPATGRRTGVKAAVCFYPYLTDVAGAAHVAGLGRHLFSTREFWTPFPVPSSSSDDPLYDPDARWKGARHNCPWNGRVWPMTNAHVIDALARVVRGFRPDWAPRLGHLLRRHVRMMTFGGDPERPNSFEHYHPITGRGSEYRGIDDYQHSWMNDLIVSHVMGVMPHGATGCTVQPLRLGVTRAELDRLPVAGHRLRVRLDGTRFTVAVNGRRAGQGRIGEPLTIAF